MKILSIGIIFLMAIISQTSAQLNFQYKYELNKPNENDQLTNIELFDYNNDGAKDIVAGFKNSENWSVIILDSSGNILSSFQNDNEFGTQMFKAVPFRSDGLAFIAVSLGYHGNTPPDDSIFVKVYDMQNYTLQTESRIKLVASDYGPILDKFEHMSVKYEGDSIYINLGYVAELYWNDPGAYLTDYEPWLLAFSYKNSCLKFENAAPKIYSICPNNNFSVGHKHRYVRYDGLEHYDYDEASFGRVNYSLPPQALNYIELRYYDDCHGIFLLGPCDSSYSQYGVMYYTTQQKTFHNYGGGHFWDNDSTFLLNSDKLASSTGISVDGNDHYILYFDPYTLEIRDRRTGEVVYADATNLSPISIQKITKDRLMYFKKTSNGFKVYGGNYSIPIPYHSNLEPWRQQNSNTAATLYDVYFVDTLKGCIVGAGGKILTTLDGGKNWTTRNSGTTAWLKSVCYVDMNTYPFGEPHL